MSRFFSNILVRNDTGRDEFVKKLQSTLSGYEECEADEADISFRAAFSERYVTITRLEYNSVPDTLNEDADRLSAALKTSAFTVTVADSDFAVLSLFTEGKQTDSVVIGDGEGYGVDECSAEPALWQPLLKPGIAFDELAAVWEKQEVFAEDALANSALLFGIEPRFMLAEFKELNNEDSMTLYFKKNPTVSQTVKPKKPDIVTAFDNVFEAALSPKGFQHYKKGSFARVIGGEILQVIEYHNTSSGKSKSFTVCTKMCSVYDPTERDKRGYFHPVPYLTNIYERPRPERYNDETAKRMNGIRYDPDDSADMTRAAHEALGYTMQIALPKYDLVKDLPSYLLIFKMIGEFGGWISTLEKCREPNWLHNACNELLYVKTRYGGDFLEQLRSEEDYNKMIAAVKARNFTPIENPYPYLDEPYSKYRDDCIKGGAKCREILDKTLADEELCDLIDRELERRKTENVKALTKLGIKI